MHAWRVRKLAEPQVNRIPSCRAAVRAPAQGESASPGTHRHNCTSCGAASEVAGNTNLLYQSAYGANLISKPWSGNILVSLYRRLAARVDFCRLNPGLAD